MNSRAVARRFGFDETFDWAYGHVNELPEGVYSNARDTANGRNFRVGARIAFKTKNLRLCGQSVGGNLQITGDSRFRKE